VAAARNARDAPRVFADISVSLLSEREPTARAARRTDARPPSAGVGPTWSIVAA